MIRVLQYIGSLHFGGSQSLIAETFRQLDKKKVMFDFVVWEEEQIGFYEEVEKLGAKIYVCPRYKGTNHFEFCKWWNNFFKQHKEYQILHGHVRSVASIYVPIAKKYGLKTIVHSHSTSNGSGISSLIKYIYQLPIRYQADYLFSCSDLAGKWLFGKKSLSKKNYYLYKNGVNCEKFEYDCKISEAIRKQWDIPQDAFVVGHIGRFCEPKNHVFIIDIFKKIVEKEKKAKLLLVGDGDLKQDIELKVKKMGLSKNVIFTGAQSNVHELYQAMDVFLFPSLYEGLPVCLVEAQASGLPCVISNTITKNVNLTSLINILDLKLSDELWAAEVLKFQSKIRNALSCEEKPKLREFDSRNVTRDLENYYYKIIKD